MSRNDKIIDESYLNYIRFLSCAVPLCGKNQIDPHHLKAVGWREGKRNDYTAIPLCREHHSEVEQIGTDKFCSKYSIENLWKDAFFILCGWLGETKPNIWLDCADGSIVIEREK